MRQLLIPTSCPIPQPQNNLINIFKKKKMQHHRNKLNFNRMMNLLHKLNTLNIEKIGELGDKISKIQKICEEKVEQNLKNYCVIL